MSTESAKSAVLEKLRTFLVKLTQASLKPPTKVKVLKLAIYPRLSFELKNYDFSFSWIIAELDALVHSHIRRWLELPISTCVKEVLCLPLNKCGMNIPSLKDYASKLRLTKRNCLRSSDNLDIVQLWSETAAKNVNSDAVLIASDSFNSASHVVKAESISLAFGHVIALPMQGVSIKSITENLTANQISAWSKEINNLPAVLFNFVRKSLMQQLATNGNLRRWGRITDGSCPLCKNVQTNKHVLSNCNAASALERYKVRHNAVLRILCQWINNTKQSTAELFADISGYEPLSTIFKNLRPDIAVVYMNNVHILELTVCHETNLVKSKEYKRTKYAAIQSDCVDKFKALNFVLHTVESTTLDQTFHNSVRLF